MSQSDLMGSPSAWLSQPLPRVMFTLDTSQRIPERGCVGSALHLCPGVGLAALSPVVWAGNDDEPGLLLFLFCDI